METIYKFNKLLNLTLVILLIVFIFSAQVFSNIKEGKLQEKEGLYAIFETSMGIIVCELFEKESPKTVKNFVELAKGEKEWLNPKTGQKVKSQFYNGLIFHRVIPNFMIQGGCPLGNGQGDPGYEFEDEYNPTLKFDKPGKLAMANKGPNTNGSQFFITEAPTPWLEKGGNPRYPENMHTIFGEVIKGFDVVKKIANVSRDLKTDKPLKDVVIKKIEFKRIISNKTK